MKAMEVIKLEPPNPRNEILLDHEKRLTELEKWKDKVDTHEKLISEGTVDAVVFENNMLKGENAKLRESNRNLVATVRDTQERYKNYLDKCNELDDAKDELDKYKRLVEKMELHISNETVKKYNKEVGL